MLSPETYGATYGLIKKTMQGAGAIKGDKGDKGDRGEKGEKGDKGDAGENGEKGDRGYTGAKGEDGVTPAFTVGSVQSGESADATVTGTAENPVLNLVLPKGEKGDKGETGRDGKDGQNGSSFSIRSRFANESDLLAAYPNGPDNEGDAYFVGTGVSPDLYVWLVDSEEWHNNGPIAGVKGDKGDTGDTGADGFSPVAQVTKADGVTTISIRDKTGVTTESILDGEKGADGKSAYEVAVDEGFLGSESEWLAELKGEKGDTGEQGLQGKTGFAPTATVTQLSDGAVIEIEDENGKTSATVRNVAGELVPSISKYQSGSFTVPADTEQYQQKVDLSEEMPDSDYIVVFQPQAVDGSMYVTQIGARAYTKTSFYANLAMSKISLPQVINWQAFKLIVDSALLKNESQITQNQKDIQTLQSEKNSKITATENTDALTDTTTFAGVAKGENPVNIAVHALSKLWTYISGKITGAVSTVLTSNLTKSRAVISDANGKLGVSGVTSTELGYLSGVTSAIQTQLNGKQASGSYKTTQTAVADPSASGTTITAIDTISQNAQGVITATKKTIRSATTSQTGVTQLNNTLTSTSTTQALTAAQGKALQDSKQATLTVTVGEWTKNTAYVTNGSFSWRKYGRFVIVTLNAVKLKTWTDGDKVLTTNAGPLPMVHSYGSIGPLNGTGSPQLFAVSTDGKIMANGGLSHEGEFYGSFTYISAS